MANVVRLCFRVQAGDNFLDISKALAVHNRSKDYHQKMVYTVVGGMAVDNATNTIELATAPNTWYTRAAVNRVFEHWKKYRSRTLETSGQTASEYADFKIALNAGGTGSYRNAIAHDRTNLSSYEWSFSAVENDAGLAKTFQIMGDHTPTRYAAMKGWIENTHLPQNSEPNMPDLNADGVVDYQVDYLTTLDGTNDNITDQVIDVVEENDSLPYDQLQAYGSNLADSDNLQSQCLGYLTATNPQFMIAGFEALCGLIKVTATAGTEINGALIYLDVLSTGRPF